LQRHDLTLQLGYQSSQVLSAQGGDVFGATHSGNVAQNAGGLQDPTAIQPSMLIAFSTTRDENGAAPVGAASSS
jgi:hypothetical protein